MMTTVRSWAKDNATLIYFLIAQAGVLISGGAWGLTYMVNLESRVATLETRGSPHLADINNRLTVLEKTTEKNADSISRIVDVMTKKLSINPQ
jgi:uncharacterized coiled-coil protein SlyX